MFVQQHMSNNHCLLTTKSNYSHLISLKFKLWNDRWLSCDQNPLSIKDYLERGGSQLWILLTLSVINRPTMEMTLGSKAAGCQTLSLFSALNRSMDREGDGEIPMTWEQNLNLKKAVSPNTWDAHVLSRSRKERCGAWLWRWTRHTSFLCAPGDFQLNSWTLSIKNMDTDSNRL